MDTINKTYLQKYIMADRWERARCRQKQIVESLISLELEVNQLEVNVEKELIYAYFTYETQSGCVRGESMDDGTAIPNWIELYVGKIPDPIPAEYWSALQQAKSEGVGLKLIENNAGLVAGMACEGEETEKLRIVLDRINKIVCEIQKAGRAGEHDEASCGSVPDGASVN